jgi:predicted O-linked N-acetylglucosamine transferase (SPINDLY family)
MQASAYLNHGNELLLETKLGEAIENYKTALSIDPHSAETLYNIGRALSLQGKMAESEGYLRRALELEPDNLVIYQAIFMKMNYNPCYTASAIASEHFRVGKMLTEPFAPFIAPFQNERSSSRRLKIGYVSPNFHTHSVAYYIKPVLSKHDHGNFEIFCYSDVSNPDDTTIRLQGYADKWRNILNIPDEEVAQLIRNDKIDILVDLAGHTGPRMLLFANKSAPIQVTWIGYPVTTGLSTMDYKVVDHYTDQPGKSEHLYTETLLRMPQTFLCYLPEEESPDLGELPALKKGHITFGSFNNLPKLSPEMFSLFSEILSLIPDSHLLMKAGSLTDHDTRQYVLDIFKRKGIEETRIEFMSWMPSKREHLNAYNSVDIALDTYPYNGTTTICMWMGSPVISLSGEPHASRIGASLLSNIGLPDLIAKDKNEYIQKAVDLANDVKKLELLRSRLRDMMIHSPLTDATAFTAHLEHFYSKIWED